MAEEPRSDAVDQDIVAALSPPLRLMFSFLCCMEESDRQSGVIRPVWPQLWPRLGLSGDVIDVAAALEPLERAGLIEIAEETASGGQAAAIYRLHPEKAEAGRAQASEDLRAAVDDELANFWGAVFQLAQAQDMGGAGGLAIHAGRSAVLYMLRRQRWQDAAAVLERLVSRDSSPEVLDMALPPLQHIAAATADTEDWLQNAGLLAQVLRRSGGREEAEALLREILTKAVERADFHTALAESSELISLLREQGRLEETLALVDEKREYTRRVGLGPWTQLWDEVQRLQLLEAMGRHEEVLEAMDVLGERMQQLPEKSEQEESVEPWNVYETILNLGTTAAINLAQWELALALNGEVMASQQARGAPNLELARTYFNNYVPLLRLGSHDEAWRLLLRCRYEFEQERDVAPLGKVFSALADLESRREQFDQAMKFAEAALRYSYLAGSAEDCSLSHFNLADYLTRADGEPAQALAHRLAAAVIDFQSSSGRWGIMLEGLARHLAAFAEEPPLPKSFAELCALVEQIEGVRLREVFEAPPRRATTGDEALAQVLRLAQETSL